MPKWNKYLILAKELKKNTEILENTLNKFNLKIIQYSYQPLGDDDADCELIMEILAIEGNSLPENVVLKINIYNEEGEIILHDQIYVFVDNFDGYDTEKTSLYYHSRLLVEAKSARIYAVKN